jgi:DNA-binding MarR family transcriptional regulator
MVAMDIMSLYSLPVAERVTTGFLLWRVTMKFRAAVDRALADLGLTHAQYSLLASLYGMSRTGARPSQRELADHTGLEPIFVSKLARALEQVGLLDRTTHPADPRAVALALTERGTEVVSTAIERVRGLHDDLLAPIGGVASSRNRELATTLTALLQAAPRQATRPTGRHAVTAPVSTLTGQDIGETEGAVRALLEEVLAGTGCTADEYIVLRVVALRPSMSRPELQAFLHRQRQLRLEPHEAAALVDRMDRAGLIAGDDAAQATELGTRLYGTLVDAVQEVTGRLYAGLDQADLVTAKQVLGQVAARAATLRAEVAARHVDEATP